MSNPDKPLTPAGEEATRPGSPVPLQDAKVPASSSAAETLVGMSASAGGQEPATPLSPGDQAIHNQDTVVSPRLRQMAMTPSQPLRPPPGALPKKPFNLGLPIGGSPSRLPLLIGTVAVLVLLAVVLVALLLATQGRALLARLNPTETPTPAPTLAASPTSIFPATFTLTPIPPTPTVKPTAAPPTATPRPAPTALGKDVLAKVTPPEGIKLKVRDKASTAGAVLGELDKDAQVTIVDGPQEANGITWWKVDDGKGLQGWSAEGVGTVKYLVPVGWAR